MNVLLSGGSGLIGSSLRSSLEAEGHRVTRLVRRAPESEGEIQWDPMRGVVDASRLEDHDVAIHLSGDNIASGRWTKAKMRRIRESRIETTRFLCTALGDLKRPPHSFLCASAIGIYGDRGDDFLDESSSPGSGFLPEVGAEWEEAALSLRGSGARVVPLRFGVVLTPEGGALKKMLPVFKMGLGGRLGSGRQWFSWISLPDAVAAIRFIIDHGEIDGPVNIVAPTPVTNLEFTKTLGAVLGRPTLIPVPRRVLWVLFGRMADEALLASARVVPKALIDANFPFLHTTVDVALKSLLRER